MEVFGPRGMLEVDGPATHRQVDRRVIIDANCWAPPRWPMADSVAGFGHTAVLRSRGVPRSGRDGAVPGLAGAGDCALVAHHGHSNARCYRHLLRCQPRGATGVGSAIEFVARAPLLLLATPSSNTHPDWPARCTYRPVCLRPASAAVAGLHRIINQSSGHNSTSIKTIRPALAPCRHWPTSGARRGHLPSASAEVIPPPKPPSESAPTRDDPRSRRSARSPTAAWDRPKHSPGACRCVVALRRDQLEWGRLK